MSIDYNDLPAEVKNDNKRTFRALTIDNKKVEFSDGFADLHTEVYKDILSGNGFGLADSKPSVALAHDIRNTSLSKKDGDMHPFVKKYE